MEEIRMKKYVKPIAEKVEFNYEENVVASGTPSGCEHGGNQGGGNGGWGWWPWWPWFFGGKK